MPHRMDHFHFLKSFSSLFTLSLTIAFVVPLTLACSNEGASFSSAQRAKSLDQSVSEGGVADSDGSRQAGSPAEDSAAQNENTNAENQLPNGETPFPQSSKTIDFVVERVTTPSGDDESKDPEVETDGTIKDPGGETKPPLRTLTVTLDSQILAIGESTKALVKDENSQNIDIQDVTVTIQPPEYLKQNGELFEALAAGEATLSFSKAGFNSVSLKVLVTAAKLLNLAFDPSKASLLVGEVFPFTIKAVFTDGEKDVTSLATLTHDAKLLSLKLEDQKASLTALDKGNSTVTARFSAPHHDAVISKEAILEVATIPAPITKVTIRVPSNLRVTDTFPLSVWATLSTGLEIDVTDLASEVLVNDALGYESSTKTFSVEGMGTASISLIVDREMQRIPGQVEFQTLRAPLRSIAILPDNKKIAEGSWLQYKALGTLADESTLDITDLAVWSTSDPAQALFPEANEGGAPGKVKAIRKGADAVKIGATYEGIRGETSLTILSCTSGTLLGVWKDPTRSGIRLDENFLGDLLAFRDPANQLSAAKNYDYYSASAHPVIGPKPSPDKLNVFLFEDSAGINLNFYANLDDGGSADNKYNVDVSTTGNALADKVILSDDSGEFKTVTTDTVNSSQSYEGRFQYWKNTDGAVLGPFSGLNWTIRFQILATGDIKDAAFHSADGESFSLIDQSNAISSFIVGFRSKQVCQ